MYDEILKEKQIYAESNAKLAKAAVELQNAREFASDSTKDISRKVNSHTSYFVNLSDFHIPEGNMFILVDTIKKLAQIPNLFFGFGGDQINNSIKSSVGDTHSEVINPQDQVKLLANILLEANKSVDIINKIVFIEAGNHENRTDNDVSINPAYLLACELGIQERYSKNICRFSIESQKRENPEKKVKTVLIVTHGEQKPGKMGAQAEAALASNLDQGADIVVYGHNHKIATASSYKQFNENNKMVQKGITYVNFGASIAGGDYADKANYPYPRVSDMEILRMTNVNSEKKFDFINYRSLINDIAQEKLNEIAKVKKVLENRKYKSINEINENYYKDTVNLYKTLTKEYNEQIKIKEEMLKKSSISDKIYFVPLSGFNIGNEDKTINIDEIKQKIDILAKLNGACKVVLNGDMVFYKKAFTLTNKNGSLLGEKFPEESFSYLETLAKLLEPIKHKIIAYNSGKQEESIMKYQSEALAKMAMSRLQMDEKLCFMPYNKVKLEAEKLKIQAKQVETYNKGVLGKAVETALKDVEGAIEEALPYSVENFNMLEKDKQYKLVKKAIDKYNSLPVGGHYNNKGQFIKKVDENKQLDFLKDILSKKLRSESAFLNLSEDSVLVNYKFPLQDIELRIPHENLVQHILCSLLGINPKEIVINPKSNQTSYVTAKIKDNKNKIRTIDFLGSALNSKGGRSTVENYLKSKQILFPTANVYFTNSKLGKEFMMLDKSIITSTSGKKYKVDTVFISGGTFANGTENELAANKIYKLFAVENNNKKSKSKSIYANTENPFNLYCESLNYENILLEDDVLFAIIKNQMKLSYKKMLTKFEQEQSAKRINNNIEKFDNAFEKATNAKEKENNPELNL